MSKFKEFRAVSAAVAVAAALSVSAVTMPAEAADLGGYDANVEPIDNSPPVRLFNWHGFYAGINGGYAWGNTEAAIIDDDAYVNDVGSVDPSGFLGGGQIGFNALFGNFLIGVEADLQGGWVDGKDRAGVDFASADLNWLSTIRARAGFAADRMLIYATGGVAWADMDYTANVNGNRFSGGETATGYAVGGGIEWALSTNWTAKAEYLYIDLDDTRISDGAGDAAKFDNAFHTMRVGLNYKF